MDGNDLHMQKNYKKGTTMAATMTAPSQFQIKQKKTINTHCDGH